MWKKEKKKKCIQEGVWDVAKWETNVSAGFRSSTRRGFIFRLCHIYAFPQRGSPAEFGWMNTLQCRFTLIKRCTLNQCTNPKLNYLEQKWKWTQLWGYCHIFAPQSFFSSFFSPSNSIHLFVLCQHFPTFSSVPTVMRRNRKVCGNKSKYKTFFYARQDFTACTKNR